MRGSETTDELERSITSDIEAVLKNEPHSFVFKLAGGMYQRAGMPDLYFTCAAIGGRSVWIEVKRPGKKPRKLQHYKLGLLARAGAIAVSVESVGEVRELLVDLKCKARKEAVS